MEKILKREQNLIVPKCFRRDVRARKMYRRGYKINPNGLPKGSSRFNVIGISWWGSSAIYSPKRKKLKGWQKNRA